ncbi:MAG: choice-of-anchor J domain-containing protein, partial [Phycisphaerales bacterium]|nr:choice-of-anchor J domain-containing protein [Phycisphaerales bacterium]
MAGLFLSAPMTAGDVPFEESFESLGPPAGDGPSGLVDAGWQFSVQATAGGGEVWHEGPECGACWPNWPAYDGDHYLMIGDGIVAGPGDAASAWAVLPDVPGIAPGDVLTFRLRGFPNFTDVLQVRFAPNGGTGTGTGAFDVGDFTDLLFEEDLRVPCEFPFGCAMDDEWYIVQVPIPRAGRLAVRYFIPQQASGGSGSHVAIDALAIGPALSEPPYPAPGETVHWTLDGSPYVVPDHRTVPAGATVIIDAGVTIDIEDEKSILVEGVVEAQGTAAQPIVVNAPSPLAHIDVSGGGIVMFDHVDIGCRLQVEPGNIFGSPRGTFIATNAHFRDHADIGGAQLGHARALLVLDQCTFDGTRVRHSLCQADVRHATFTDSGQIGLSLHGYVYLEDVSMTNGQIELGARRGPQ